MEVEEKKKKNTTKEKKKKQTKNNPDPPIKGGEKEKNNANYSGSPAIVVEEENKNTTQEIEPDITDDNAPDPFEFEEEEEKTSVPKDGVPNPKEKYKLYRVCTIDTGNSENNKVSQTWRTGSKESMHRRPDSYIYQYSRNERFLRDDHEEEEGDKMIKAARDDLHASGDGQIKSHEQRVTRFSYFELYCLVHHPDHAWSKWLLTLTSCENKVKFIAPSKGLVTAYGKYLRKDMKHKGGAIRVYVGSITSVCKEFGVDESPTTEIQPAIVKWENDDGNDSAPAFDFVQEMPHLFAVCFAMSGWAFDRKLKCWTMFLIAMSIFGRASDLTIFCPVIEDLFLPPEQLWDVDGYPQWIELGLRDWKWRSKPNKGKRYGLRLHRNYVDTRFCPVIWLLFWLSHSKLTSGPIFQKPNGEHMSEAMWTGMTDRLFLATGLYDKKTKKGCTNHSIRRTAVQWAGRCWVNALDAKNTGRWKTYDDMSDYFAQGGVDRAKAVEGATHDPVLSMWVWKPNTVASYDGKNQM